MSRPTNRTTALRLQLLEGRDVPSALPLWSAERINPAPTVVQPTGPAQAALDRGVTPVTRLDDAAGTVSLDQPVTPVAAGLGSQASWVVAPPHVRSVLVGDGSRQRSQVTSLTVMFDQSVTIDGAPSDAFSLTREGSPVAFAVQMKQDAAGATVVTLTDFGGRTPGASLADGIYVLTVRSDRVHGAGGPLDGDNDGQPGGDYVTKVQRLFGDATGDGRVDSGDLAFFAKSYLKSSGAPGYLAYLDFNNDGHIDVADLGQFASRYIA